MSPSPAKCCGWAAHTFACVHCKTGPWPPTLASAEVPGSQGHQQAQGRRARCRSRCGAAQRAPPDGTARWDALATPGPSCASPPPPPACSRAVPLAKLVQRSRQCKALEASPCLPCPLTPCRQGQGGACGWCRPRLLRLPALKGPLPRPERPAAGLAHQGGRRAGGAGGRAGGGGRGRHFRGGARGARRGVWHAGHAAAQL